MVFNFPKLEIKPEGNWIKRNLFSKHAKRTVLAVVIGAILGIVYFYFTEGQHMTEIVWKDITRAAFFGAFFGFFITNSPCARGRC